jgi:phenylacetate-coenzyme A ligase PaaK-like adenylate-forming protein
MNPSTKLFYKRRLYDTSPETERLFTRAMIENAAHHNAHCREYAAILKSRGFDFGDVGTADDLYKIPPIPTAFLKNHTLLSTERKLMFASTTSGTSGRVSTAGLDRQSSLRGLGMILNVFFTHRLVSVRPTNYIVLGYEPAKRNKIGAVKTAYATTYAAPALRREYALKDMGEEYALNLGGLKRALIDYERSGHPVRFMGFPAYFMFLLRELEESGIALKLHPKSLVMLAGGWKQFFTEQVDKPVLYEMSKRILGIGEERIREFFGAVEHPIIYTDCPNHHFHVPIYAKVIIRDSDLTPLPYGVPGMLNLLTPMVTSMPFSSVMTDDLAVLHKGEDCGCGISSPYVEILGRVGLADVKTCAAGAAELLSVLTGGSK